MIWKRSRAADKNESDAGRAGYGIGVQVIVRLERSGDPDSAVEELLSVDPVGVIVAPGESVGSQLYAPAAPREAVWQVQFDEPFVGLDGSGPHLSALVPQSRLEIAPEA
ncbi:hypothetical protein [Glaciibacter sp. 2TAF33]|uniref:hypothetical protein n=1 Tax=Glaciibacter sp. 2TAF33 TaxID=3233015 RepID=UPI003F914131